MGYLPQAFELNETLSVRDNILEGASDVLAWIREYESGQGTEAHQATLLEKINLADGWHLESSAANAASFLSAPPMDCPVSTLSGGENGESHWLAPWSRHPTSCSWTNRPTISTPKPSAGWRKRSNNSRERSCSPRTTVIFWITWHPELWNWIKAKRICTRETTVLTSKTRRSGRPSPTRRAQASAVSTSRVGLGQSRSQGTTHQVAAPIGNLLRDQGSGGARGRTGNGHPDSPPTLHGQSGC